MNIEDKFTELENRNEGALITHICAGDPTPDVTAEIVHALMRGGADLIELGRALDASMNREPFFDLARSLDVDTVDAEGVSGEGALIIYMRLPQNHLINMSTRETDADGKVVAGIIGGGLLGGAVGGAAGDAVGALIGAVATDYINQQNRHPK